MYGGPFYSAGFVRIIDGQKYRCRHVSFAHWVSLMNGGRSMNNIEVRKVVGRSSKLVATVADEAALGAFFSKQHPVAAGDSVPCDAAGILYNDPRAAI